MNLVGQRIWDKVRSYWEHIGDTHWEHMGKNKKSNTPTTLLQKEKKKKARALSAYYLPSFGTRI